MDIIINESYDMSRQYVFWEVLVENSAGQFANCVIANGHVATMAGGDIPYGLIEDGAIAVEAGRVAWVGEKSNLPDSYNTFSIHDLGDRVVTPALIDCHTHIVYGGNRAREFEMRLEGASYEEISKAGGGIVSTVTSTRSASEDDLLAAALPRVDRLISEGVSTIEIKSGYGLDVETEARMLRVARRIGKTRPVRVKTAFLGAHALPQEFSDRPDDYIQMVCEEALPKAAGKGLVDAVDAFCEGIAFSPEQVAKVFEVAQRLDIPVKIHAEQLSNLGGTEMAAGFSALSSDHLEYLDEAGVRAMAKAGVVAVILPGAFYTLRETKLPPIELLRANNVPLAIATDCNPGSSPVTSLLLILNMACTLFHLTPEEALTGVTRNAAKALGLEDDLGEIAVGKIADLAVWDIAHPSELSYNIGLNPLHTRIWQGVVA
jgi:imidazolonepropionase